MQSVFLQLILSENMPQRTSMQHCNRLTKEKANIAKAHEWQTYSK